MVYEGLFATPNKGNELLGVRVHGLCVESNSQFESTSELKSTAKKQISLTISNQIPIFALEIWKLEILCMA